MADSGDQSGRVAMFGEDGELISQTPVGFQPAEIVKTAPNTYWVSNDNGTVKELTRVGDSLTLSGRQVALGHGFFASMAISGPNQVSATIDDGHTFTFATFNSATCKVLTTAKTTGPERAGQYAAVTAGLYWTTKTDDETRTSTLIGISPTTGKVVKEYPTAAGGRTAPQGMAVDADGDLWIVDSKVGTLTEYAPSTGAVKQELTISHGALQYPLGVTYSKRLDKLAVSVPSEVVDRSDVAIVDPATATVDAYVPLTGDYPSALAFTNDGSIWTANLRHRVGHNEGGTMSILRHGR
jgi:hypothetical protein